MKLYGGMDVFPEIFEMVGVKVKLFIFCAECNSKKFVPLFGLPCTKFLELHFIVCVFILFSLSFYVHIIAEKKFFFSLC